MDRFDIQKLRDLPIEEVANRLGLEVCRHRSLCPFHQDSHPSLTYSVSRNYYRCFVCGAHGGVIDLAMGCLPAGKGSFIEACRWLADAHNVIIADHHAPVKEKVYNSYPPDVEYLSSLVARPVLIPEARHFLFDQRHYDPKVIEWLGISSISRATPCWRYGKPFYDAPSLLFPYRDMEGRVLNVQSRYLGSVASTPRFRFPANSTIQVFNLPILRYLEPDEPLYVSEGITDCMALLSAHHKAIAIPSATLLKADELMGLLLPLRGRWRGTLNIYPDRDAPGEELYRKLVTLSTQMGVCLIRHELPPGCKDYSDCYLSSFISKDQ